MTKAAQPASTVLGINLTFATNTSFGTNGFQHLVRLHHAAVGEATVVLIRIAAPREVGCGASAAASLGELNCPVEITREQIGRAHV